MNVAIRELDTAELAAVSGGNVASDLGKIAWGLTGALCGGSIAGAASAAIYILGSAFLNKMSSCGQCGGDMGQPM